MVTKSGKFIYRYCATPCKKSCQCRRSLH